MHLLSFLHLEMRWGGKLELLRAAAASSHAPRTPTGLRRAACWTRRQAAAGFFGARQSACQLMHAACEASQGANQISPSCSARARLAGTRDVEGGRCENTWQSEWATHHSNLAALGCHSSSRPLEPMSLSLPTSHGARGENLPILLQAVRGV